MTSERRSRLLLLTLGVLVTLFVLRKVVPRLLASESPEIATTTEEVRGVDALMADNGSAANDPPRSRRPSRGVREAPVVGTPRFVALQLDKLDPSTAHYEGGRNPFSFYLPPPPPPPPPPGPTAEELEALRRAREEAAARAAAAAEERARNPPPPQPPPILYTYLGRFGPRDRPIAVLTLDKEIHNVLVGDVLDGKFRLVAIGLESVEFEFVDFPDAPVARLPVGTEGT